MFVEERKLEILNILKKKERVSVNELSEYFNISKVIIRRDLCQMEKDGTLERTHGGAILKKKISDKISFQDISKNELSLKTHFANIIIEQVEEGDIIFLDGSLSTVIASYFLQKRKISITVITNSIEVINILSKNKNINLISLGGELNLKTKLFLGDISTNNLKLFNFNKVFLEPDGINLSNLNLSSRDIKSGEIKRLAVALGKKIFILAVKDIFYQDSIYNFSKLNSKMILISQEDLDSSLKNALNLKNIPYII